jgi:hypothetical protein
MHLAVEKGAQHGQSFADYVTYLADQGYVPPDGRAWVDHIRKKGNDANHEIALMTKEEAEELISFLEMLLKFMFEFPRGFRPAPEARATIYRSPPTSCFGTCDATGEGASKMKTD